MRPLFRSGTNRAKVLLLLVSTFFPSFLRVALWRALGFRVGPGCAVSPLTVVVAEEIELGPGVEIAAFSFIYVKKLMMGERSSIASFVRVIGRGTGMFGRQTFVGMGCMIEVRTEFRLGDRTGLGPRGTYFTHGDSGGLTCVKRYRTRYGPIVIGKDCWIGMACVVYPNVTIGDGTVVFPGIVVTSDLPANKAVVPSGHEYRVMPVGVATFGVDDRTRWAKIEEALKGCAEAYAGSKLVASGSDVWELRVPRRGRIVLLRDDSGQEIEASERESTIVWRLNSNGKVPVVPTFVFSELVAYGDWTPFAEEIATLLVTNAEMHFAFCGQTAKEAK